jgi:hypothetical protein
MGKNAKHFDWRNQLFAENKYKMHKEYLNIE